ncbi:MAG TPA: hypothetical protein VGG69_10120 [Rhizomicrobium sp.]
MRSRLSIAGFAALALAGGGVVADATARTSLDLPMQVNTTIAAPATRLVVQSDGVDTIVLAPAVHVRIAALTSAPDFFQFAETAPSVAPPEPNLPLSLEIPESNSSAAALDVDFTKWGGLGLTAMSATGPSDLLGTFTPNSLTLTGARTSAAGLSAHVKFGDGWVTSFSYNTDISQLDLKAGASPALAASTADGHSYGVSIAKRGLFGDADALGLSLSRPSDTYFGGISFADAGLESRVNLLDNYRGALANNSTKETDVALGYVTTFFNGALALQANAGYQMNVGGQTGVNSLAVLSRAKINF